MAADNELAAAMDNMFANPIVKELAPDDYMNAMERMLEIHTELGDRGIDYNMSTVQDGFIIFA